MSVTKEEGRETLTTKKNSVSGKQAKRMLLNISGNIRGKMGVGRSFESFDFPKKINCLF